MNARLPVVAIAGWLFADLLLAFSIVVLGTQDPPPDSKPTPTPTPSPSFVPTRQALERDWITVELSVSASDAKAEAPSAIEALQHAIRKEPRLVGRKAGIVLTFGAQNDGGEAFAHDVNKLLRRVNPNLFADVATRDFQLIGAGGGALILQIYLFYQH